MKMLGGEFRYGKLGTSKRARVRIARAEGDRIFEPA
jgi:hypothetical protein